MSPFRRCIKDFLDHSERPSARQPTHFLDVNRILPIQHLELPVKYDTSFTASGQGYRKLTIMEITACFGYPSEESRFRFSAASFPLLPGQVGRMLLSSYRHHKVGITRSKQQTLKPRPPHRKFHKDPRGTWVASLQKFLPHSWSSQSTSMTSSTKADTAIAEEKLWNLRILPLFPGSRTAHLNTLCSFFMRVACKRFVRSYFWFLKQEYGALYNTYTTHRGVYRHNRGVGGLFIRTSSPSWMSWKRGSV